MKLGDHHAEHFGAIHKAIHRPRKYTCNGGDLLGLHVEIALVSHVFCSSEVSVRLTGLASMRGVEEHTLTYMKQ